MPQRLLAAVPGVFAESGQHLEALARWRKLETHPLCVAG